jgi:hypothetical protein
VKLQANVKITHTRGIHSRKTATSKMENLTALGACGHVKSDTRSHCWNFDIRAKHKLWIRDEDLAVQIFAVSLEPGILFYFEDNENVAATTTSGSNVARASHRHVLTGRNAGRNMNLDFLILPNAAFSATLSAGR